MFLLCISFSNGTGSEMSPKVLKVYERSVLFRPVQVHVNQLTHNDTYSPLDMREEQLTNTIVFLYNLKLSRTDKCYDSGRPAKVPKAKK